METSFQVKDRRVAAVIKLPDSDRSPFPGIVFVDGSGSSDRHEFRQQSQWFVDSGFAVLIHDKAGCGDTAGSWRDQTLEDRATETRAALDALRSHPKVDNRNVGLWAISQGGWVAPMAAAGDARVAFMILVSTAGISPYEQEAASLAQRMRSAGNAEDTIPAALEAYWGLIERLRSSESPVEVASRFESVRRDDPRFSHFHAEIFADPATLAFFARIGDHDPIPPLGKVSCPILLIYGADDVLVPVERSRTIIVEQLDMAGNDDVAIEVFPGADHNLLVGPPSTGPGGSHPFAAGVGELMTEWARGQTTRSQ